MTVENLTLLNFFASIIIVSGIKTRFRCLLVIGALLWLGTLIGILLLPFLR